MKVLHLAGRLPTRERPGRGRFILTQIDSLQAGEVESIVSGNGRFSPAGFLRRVRNIRRLLREEEIDLIHAHFGLEGLAPILIGEKPVVLSLMGNDILPRNSPRFRDRISTRIVNLLSQTLARFAACNVAKSAELRERLWSRKAREKTVVIPNGVDQKLFRPLDRAACRRKLDLQGSEGIVLFVSDPAEYRKRFDLAQQAVALTRRKGHATDLFPICSCPHDRLPLYYGAADCLLLTSDSEGSPNVVKEALACGLPVVSVDVGDVRARIESLEGCHICTRDPQDLARAIVRVLEAGRRVDPQRAVRGLEMETISTQMLGVYGRVVQENRQRSARRERWAPRNG